MTTEPNHGSRMGFHKIAAEFRKYHSTAFNVLLHLFTAPLCILSTYWLTNEFIHPIFGPVVSLLWTIVLIIFGIPTYALLPSFAALALLAWLSVLLPQAWPVSLAAFAAGYALQELAHWVTGELTYQQSYQGGGAFLPKLAEHTFLLFPLIFDAAWLLRFPLVALPTEQSNVIWTDITDEQQVSDMITIRHWTLSQGEAKSHTIHHWFDNLPKPIKEAYDRLAHSPDLLKGFQNLYPEKSHNVDVLEGMNEIYQTAPSHFSSDRVFYQWHVDGPWCFFPFCYVFRCLLALSPNSNIVTIFPFDDSKGLLATGKAVAFDFNREVHYIEAIDPNVSESRIALKLHFAVYPKWLAPLGKLCGFLTTMYDQIARWWFLQTLTPKTTTDKSFTWVTLIVTFLVARFHMLLGSNNVMYVGLCYLIDRFVCPGSFLYLTSFVHYLHYIGTYYYRYNINYGCFKRTVVFFKGLAVCQIIYIYVNNLELNYLSIGLIASGVFLATTAALALGTDRTYFGAELGKLKPKWIEAFPYNTGIPHPMIVGAWMWLYGCHCLPGFAREVPYLIPLHMTFYAIHCLQEHFDIYYRADPQKREH